MSVESAKIEAGSGPPTPSSAESSAISQADVQALLGMHYSGLRLLVLRRTRDPQVAADILNGAIAKTLEHLQANRIGNPEQVAGWVYRVALNDLNNYRRNMHNRGAVRDAEEVLQSLPDEGDASDSVAEHRMADLVRGIIEQLPTERDRLIIKRFYLDEADKDEICREFPGLSTLHFDRVIHRARQRMRELLEKRGLKRSDFFSILCAA
jgi:RNA polymerase sigma-70 factor, ECF subfamily